MQDIRLGNLPARFSSKFITSASTFEFILQSKETVTMINWTCALRTELGDNILGNDFPSISPLEETRLQDISMLCIGTSNGRISLRLDGTLLVRDIELVPGIPVVATLLASNSFASLSFLNSKQKELPPKICLDSCIPLSKHARDLSDLASICNFVDSQLNSARLQIDILTQEIKNVENNAVLPLYNEVSNSFSDLDTPPSLQNWEQLILTGVLPDVMIFQSISCRLQPKKISSLEAIVNSSRIKIFNIFHGIFTKLSNASIKLTEFANFSRINNHLLLSNSQLMTESASNLLNSLILKLNRLQSQLNLRFKSFLSFSQFLFVLNCFLKEGIVNCL